MGEPMHGVRETLGGADNLPAHEFLASLVELAAHLRAADTVANSAPAARKRSAPAKKTTARRAAATTAARPSPTSAAANRRPPRNAATPAAPTQPAPAA